MIAIPNRDNSPFRLALPALLAALAAMAIFAVTLPGGFAYDFWGIARSDPRLLDPHSWWSYWKEAYLSGVDNLYRPLTSMVMAIQSWTFGLDEARAWRFHMVSVILHAGASALVAELARRLLSWRAALIAGLLFAAHPLHVEAVTDVVGQAEMLCALGTLAATVLFLRRPMTILRVLAIFGCFVVALLSKEQGMLLPLLLLILSFCLQMRPIQAIAAMPVESSRAVLAYSDLSTSRADNADRQSMLWLIVLLCFALGAYIFVRENVLHLKFWWNRGFLDPAINPVIRSRGLDRLLVPVAMLGRYTMLLIFPWKLAPDYSGVAIGSTAHFDDPYLYLGFGAIVAWLLLFAIAIRRRLGVMLYCLIGVALAYGLISNLVTIIGTNFAERLMYLPSVFFLILIAMGLARLPARALVPLMAVILALASVRSFTYARRWNDRLILYGNAVRDQPGAVRMYMMYSWEQYQRGDPDGAAATLAAGRAIMPEYATIWTFSAALALEMNDFDKADEYLRHAESIEPSMRTVDLERQLEEKRAAATRKSG